jgi:hypothetical protein
LLRSPNARWSSNRLIRSKDTAGPNFSPAHDKSVNQRSGHRPQGKLELGKFLRLPLGGRRRKPDDTMLVSGECNPMIRELAPQLRRRKLAGCFPLGLE